MSKPTMFLRLPPRTRDEMQATIFAPLQDDGLFDPDHDEYTPRKGALWEAWKDAESFSYGTRLELTPPAAAELLWQLASTQDIVEVQASSSYDPRDNAVAAGVLQSWKAKRRRIREWLTDEAGAEIEGGGFTRLPKVTLPGDE